jgi:hypothetical protein
MRAVSLVLPVLGCLLLPPALRADDAAELKAVIDKAVQAMGGKDKVARFQAGTWKAKAEFEEGGQQITLVCEGAWQGPDKVRLDAEITQGGQARRVLMVINGNQAWMKMGDEVKDAPEGVVTILKDAWHALRMAHLLPELKAPAFQLSPLGEAEVQGRPAVGISVAREGRKPVNVHFDKQTGLPVKGEVRLTDPDGKEITLEYFYSDLREVEGVKHPMKLTLKADGKEFAVEITEIKPKDKVDESEFARP